MVRDTADGEQQRKHTVSLKLLANGMQNRECKKSRENVHEDIDKDASQWERE